MNANTDKKNSDEFFLFLCDHTVNVHDNYLSLLTKRRGNILTVMSFCFIGGLTFIAGNLDAIAGEFTTAGFSIAFIGLWLASFLSVLIASVKPCYYRVVPGNMDGISFLPSSEDSKDFYKSKTKPFDADVFFIKRYLETVGHAGYDVNDYVSLLHEYHACIKDLPDIEDMNKNAWLASLVHISIAQREKVIKVLRVYQWAYFSLWISLVLLFVAVILCMF